jgi:hypothetical protein
MDPKKLDELAKAIATTPSRRQLLKALAAGAASWFFAGIAGGSAQAHHNRPCRDAGSNCSANAECCTGFCIDFHCACPPDLPNLCPGREECLPACTGGKVFLPGDCTCQCPPETEECGGRCLPLCLEGFERNRETCLCEAIVPPHPECTGATCATFTPCASGNLDCVCAGTPAGGGICVPGSTPCGGLTLCGPAPEFACPTNEVCVVDTCCGEPVCVNVALAAQCPAETTSTGITSFTIPEVSGLTIARR